MSLPPFLIPRLPAQAIPLPYIDAVFCHPLSLSVSHSLWWSPKLAVPETVVLFIPGMSSSVNSLYTLFMNLGNPGLLNLYTSFLTALHNKDTTLRLAILGHSHVGHTPGVESKGSVPQDITQHGLNAQVQASLEAYDAIRSTFGGNIKVIIIGHSVGAWLSLQVFSLFYEEPPSAYLLRF